MAKQKPFTNFSYEVAFFRGNYAVVCTEWAEPFARNYEKHDISTERYDKKGCMSKNVKRNLTKRLRILINSLTYSSTHRRPTFATLTLPAQQKTTDKEMNKRFAEFIKLCKSKTSMEQYVWRAEPQENGNIHYHIVWDSYVDKTLLTKMWCQVLERDGYITDYRTNNNKANDVLPPCTKIHSLKGINNTIEYLAKYMSKTEEEENNADTAANIIPRRKLQCHLWGCSDELRNEKEPKILLDTDTYKELEEAKTETITYDYITVIKCKLSWKKTPNILKQVSSKYQEIYKRLYHKPPNEINFKTNYKIDEEEKILFEKQVPKTINQIQELPF
jgi:hypothetical protein